MYIIKTLSDDYVNLAIVSLRSFECCEMRILTIAFHVYKSIII